MDNGGKGVPLAHAGPAYHKLIVTHSGVKKLTYGHKTLLRPWFLPRDAMLARY